MQVPVVIVGAGIGGLALAAALRRCGVECVVLERASDFAPLGAGITIQPNAVRALRAFELYAPIAAAGEPIRELRIRHFRGATLSRFAGQEYERRFGAKILGMHRADLHAVLLELAGTDRVRLGFEVVTFDETAAGVEVVGRSGERIAGRALVGADGLRSAVRSRLLGDGPPVYAGYTSWRGIVHGKGLVDPGVASESWGAAARFGIVAMPGERTYWYATANAPEAGRQQDGLGELAHLRERFRKWHKPLRPATCSGPISTIGHGRRAGLRDELRCSVTPLIP
jgi:2-polyprenyl-6-methoxyphenol hydroxylase-like FAD-dependent oxidoreductase